MLQLEWSTYKDWKTGYTVVELVHGGRKFRASITPYKASRMTTKEFNRLIKMLKETAEL